LIRDVYPESRIRIFSIPDTGVKKALGWSWIGIRTTAYHTRRRKIKGDDGKGAVQGDRRMGCRATSNDNRNSVTCFMYSRSAGWKRILASTDRESDCLNESDTAADQIRNFLKMFWQKFQSNSRFL
jgi:hypothetical protein